ncbi:hypothetical protein KEM48_008027 [Puccinia striiformis f. sp. tritici PST-130]|nr:hypothetical protein KEM48_008027 [Puccinia striiformis f. sp. tritici PST-130]
MSLRARTRSGDKFLEYQLPPPTVSDSSRAPFHFNSLPEPDNAFPLARETIGDDGGSIFSSSAGPSFTPKKVKGDPGPSQNASRGPANRIQAIGNPHGKGLSKEYWLPDKDVKECYDCAVVFTSWRRKHHCRICGAIFCSQCASNLVPGHRFATSGYIRVCNICLAKLEPQSQEHANLAIREDTDDETQSFSEVASGFNILGSRSQGNRAHVTTPGKIREGVRQIGEHTTTSVNHRPGRSIYRMPPDHHSARHKSLIRQLAMNDKTKTKLHPRPDSPPILRPSPIAANLFSPLTIKKSSAHRQEAVSSSPFRKGLTDEEQAGLPGIGTSSHTQSVYATSPNTSKLAAEIKQPQLDRNFSSSSHNTIQDSSQNGGSHDARLPQLLETPRSMLKVNANIVWQPSFHFLRPLLFLSETDSSMRLDESFSDFPSFSCDHVRFMIHQFLIRENIAKTPVWETELTNLLLQLISDPPRPTHDGEDDADIRKLVKIKRIPGGQIADCEYIHGVVFTKNIAHKKMKSICAAPKVLTIGMPLEFQRVDGYCKLDVLVSQERQYLKSLVSRLTSLEPDLVLVDGNVSGIAIDYFVEAGVTVLRHVKSTVLQAVARSTKTPLISSLDKLLNLEVGQCELFRVQTVHHRLIPNHHRKTFIRLEGCEPYLGGTLVLRGGDLALLTKVKSLMCSMVGIIYSLRLENSFLNDEGAAYSNDSIHEASLQEIRSADLRSILASFRHAKKHIRSFEPLKLPAKLGEPARHSELAALSGKIDDLIKPYECLLPSGSPRVMLTPPFALLKLRQLTHQLMDLRRFDAQSVQPPSIKACMRDEKYDEKLPPASSPSMPITASQPISTDGHSAKSEEVTAQVKPTHVTPAYGREEYLSHLSRQIEEERMAVHFYLSNHSSETFKAADHQHLIVQESVTCSSLGGYTCQGPHLRSFAFYSAGDQSVGQIIQMLIDCRSEICHAKGCNQPKSIHQTNWIHGHYRATIQIHLDHSNGQSEPNDLQPSDHSDFPAALVDPDLIMMQGYCPTPDWYRMSCLEHLAEVGCPAITTLISITSLQKINVYEAIPPSLVLFTPSEALIKVRELVAPANQEVSEEYMRELLKKAEVDSNAIDAQLKRLYEESIGTNGVKMNTARKTLCDKSLEWDEIFRAFEARFVMTDSKEARRLTTLPLTKIFQDQSMPGSPERLFPRPNQLPIINSQKSNYNSHSEVESDHASKGQSFETFKRAFPSPTLKSMASALVFALPSSMPAIGMPEIRSDGERQKNNSPRPLGPPLSILQSPPETASKDELMLNFKLGGDESTSGQHASAEQFVPHQLPTELSIPSVVIEPASKPSSAVGNTNKSEVTFSLVSNDKGKVRDDHESPTEMHLSSASTSSAHPAHPHIERVSLLTSSRRDSPDLKLRSDEGTIPDVPTESDGDSKSDSTVVNVRNGVARSSHHVRSESQRKKSTGSGTDATTSGLDLRTDSRRMNLRSRRPKDLVLNSREGVANLVQKYETPAKSPGPIPPPSVKAPPSVATRGKSEIVRSTMSVLRGKKPAAVLDKTGSNTDRNQSFDSLSPRPTEKQPPSPRFASRTQRPSSRIASPRGPSAHIYSNRSSVLRSGAQDGTSSAEKARVPSSPRTPGFKKEFVVPRRSRHESGLPVSSLYAHRRMNMNTKVTAIARQFDRITREAERERIKQVNEHRSRPRPIGHAKSSVQAFSSLTAAVNEDSDSDIDECEGHPAGHDADDEGDVICEAYELDNPEQEAFECRPDPSIDLPLVPEDTPAGPHPSPNLYHMDPNYHAEASTSNRPFSPSHAAPGPPTYLTQTTKISPLAVAHFSDNEMSASDTARQSSTILKAITSMWNSPSAEFLPLQYPQLPTEHQSTENPIIIREDEPSSIIAYTLCSKIYLDTLKETEPRVVERSEIFMPEEFKPRSSDIDSTWGMIDFMSDDLEVDDVLKIPMDRAKPMQFRFDVNPVTISCKVFFMHQFDALRQKLICNDIIDSLARCHKWDASGGKSGQKFLKTKDERYLIKGISKAELEALTKFAPAYFDYLSSAIKEKRPITLAKMFGIFQVSFVNKLTNRKGRLQVQVIENLWVTKPHLQIYDLKGLTRNRTVNVTGRPHEVLLDGNFCEMVRTTPILVRENSLLRLQASLHNDTLFLANHNVMDYSLAVGFDEEKQEMYIGIIDYLQTYSWDKRLETLVKELGGSSKEAPTVITPSLYKARFRRAMGRYFSVAPDPWMHKWKPYLSPSEEDTTGANPDKEGSKLPETSGPKLKTLM